VPAPAIPPQATQTPAVPSAAAPTTAAPPKPTVTPDEYLSAAAQSFMAVSTENLKSGDAKNRMADLKKHFGQLLSTYKSNADPFVPPAVPQPEDLTTDEKAQARNWKMAFSDVESDLAGILGGGSVLPEPQPLSSAGAVPVGTVGTVGTVPVVAPNGNGAPGVPVPANQAATGAANGVATNGATPQPGSVPATGGATVNGAAAGEQIGAVNAGAIAGGVGVKDLDPNVRLQLEQFRRDVELFFASAMMTTDRQP
jgi:hypothetical protein